MKSRLFYKKQIKKVVLFLNEKNVEVKKWMFKMLILYGF